MTKSLSQTRAVRNALWPQFYPLRFSLFSLMIIPILMMGQVMVRAQESESDRQGGVSLHHPESLRLIAGRSTLLEFTEPIERTSLANEAVADVVVVSPHQILVHGKQVGSTTLIIWRGGVSELRTIYVEVDLEELQKTLQHVLPDESIQVERTTNALVLAGMVESETSLQQATLVAEMYADKVVNLLRVQESTFDRMLRQLVPEEEFTTFQTQDAIILSGKAKHPANVEKAVHAASTVAERVVNVIDVLDQKQVLIEVRFVEANRSLAKSLGLDYVVQGPDFTKAGFLSGGLTPQTPSTPQFARIDPQDIALSSNVTNLFELRRGTDISIVLNALEEKGFIRILAEPNLLTMSGEEASFLAGGEFPIPVVQSAASSGGNAVTIEFKEFGIQLHFKPQVTSDDNIRMLIEPEVSILDFGPSAVNISGFKVPGLVTRRASTHVQLRSGESLVIGGLIAQTDNRTTDQIPFLGNVPILGQLFRSEKFNLEETELIVLVTPRLTQPSQVALPRRYEDMEALGRAVESQFSAPPYDDERADAIRRVIRSIQTPPSEEINPAGDSTSLESLPKMSPDLSTESLQKPSSQDGGSSPSTRSTGPGHSAMDDPTGHSMEFPGGWVTRDGVPAGVKISSPKP